MKTAWHAPLDMSPIAHTANLHLDLVSYNFGIQEFTAYPEPFQDSYARVNDMDDPGEF